MTATGSDSSKGNESVRFKDQLLLCYFLKVTNPLGLKIQHFHLIYLGYEVYYSPDSRV